MLHRSNDENPRHLEFTKQIHHALHTASVICTAVILTGKGRAQMLLQDGKSELDAEPLDISIELLSGSSGDAPRPLWGLHRSNQTDTTDAPSTGRMKL